MGMSGWLLGCVWGLWVGGFLCCGTFVFLLVCNFNLGMDSLFILTGHSGSFHPK